MAKREKRTILVLFLLPLMVLLIVPARHFMHAKHTHDLAYAIRWQYANRIPDLIASGADVNGRMPGGESFIEYAAKENQFGTVSQLIKAGARSTSLTEKLVNQQTLSNFYWAVYYDRTPQIAQLLKLGYNGNTIWREDNTFLMVAAEHGQPATIQQLLSAGANPNAHDKSRRSVLWHALSRGWQCGPFAKVLLQGGAKPDVNDRLLMAIYANDAKAAQRALKSGANPNACHTDGCPLLSLAVVNTQLVKLLLRYGADPNLKSFGMPVLCIARHMGKNSAHHGPPPDPAALALLQSAAAQGEKRNINNAKLHTRKQQKFE